MIGMIVYRIDLYLLDVELSKGIFNVSYFFNIAIC